VMKHFRTEGWGDRRETERTDWASTPSREAGEVGSVTVQTFPLPSVGEGGGEGKNDSAFRIPQSELKKAPIAQLDRASDYESKNSRRFTILKLKVISWNYWEMG